MTEANSKDKENFLYPRSKYYGEVKLNSLMFNANLQEFFQKIGYITNLQTSGKISPQKAYKQIKTLWKQLKRSKKHLGINEQEL